MKTLVSNNYKDIPIFLHEQCKGIEIHQIIDLSTNENPIYRLEIIKNTNNILNPLSRKLNAEEIWSRLNRANALRLISCPKAH